VNENVVRSFALAIALLACLVIAAVIGVMVFLSGETFTRSVTAAGATFVAATTLALLILTFLRL
jgi:hypothetical protein